MTILHLINESGTELEILKIERSQIILMSNYWGDISEAQQKRQKCWKQAQYLKGFLENQKQKIKAIQF